MNAFVCVYSGYIYTHICSPPPTFLGILDRTYIWCPEPLWIMEPWSQIGCSPSSIVSLALYSIEKFHLQRKWRRPEGSITCLGGKQIYKPICTIMGTGSHTALMGQSPLKVEISELYSAIIRMNPIDNNRWEIHRMLQILLEPQMRVRH